MDEQLISEVQNHPIIYNRQKYFLNNIAAGKYESKDDAWNVIAMKLGASVDTCKKRWKYLRERYVQQRKHKQGDPPAYEHLSRPYLEKMKFLDQHIQPRKSYRGSSQFVHSPDASAPFGDFVDSSRSNGSISNCAYKNYQDNFNNSVKYESDHMLDNFSGMNNHHHPQISPVDENQQIPPPPMQTNDQPLDYRDNEPNRTPSSSLSLKSPSSTPPTTDHNGNADLTKRPRLEPNCSSHVDVANASDDDNHHHRNHMRHIHERNSDSQYNFMYSMPQRYSINREIRSSEQLLGELVTSELLKMSTEKKRAAQRRILEVLFFDD